MITNNKMGPILASTYCRLMTSIVPLIRRLNTDSCEFDIAVIGGGIVGSASARELKIRYPTMKIALLEKEHRCAHHQSGNNSGVIHAGIYYKTGSLKAKLCVQGVQLLYKYLDEKKINYAKCGKLIVATQRVEVPRLLDLYDRGVQNGVKGLQLLNYDEMIEIQPGVTGLQGIWSPYTGIVDYSLVTKSFLNDFVNHGGKVYLNYEVNKFVESLSGEYSVNILDKKGNNIKAKYVLTCCGLHSDTVAVMTGCANDPKIVPFRGEYLQLLPNNAVKLKTNIYPVPDPRFPFLGVHLTPTIHGEVIIGPNALLAFSKEGYRWNDININELKDVLLYSGFRKLAGKYATFGIGEMMRSAFIPLQMKMVHKYFQNLSSNDVVRGMSGVRAQAMGKDGTLIEDFVFDSSPDSGSAVGSRVLHVRNAPSPGATSSMAIAKMIADRMNEQFKF